MAKEKQPKLKVEVVDKLPNNKTLLVVVEVPVVEKLFTFSLSFEEMTQLALLINYPDAERAGQFKTNINDTLRTIAPEVLDEIGV